MNYFVFSYGGCGSTMLCSFLSQFGRSYHLHDNKPPKFLTDSTPPIPITSCTVRLSQDPARRLKNENCKVIYIYRNPAESKVSRPSWQHCYHMGGDFLSHKDKISQGPLKEVNDEENLQIKMDWVEQFASNGIDYNGYEQHFDNWINAVPDRDYPILYVNYENLWENLNILLEYCGVPIEEAVKKFPAKKETTKAVPDNVTRKLAHLYSSLQQKINNTGTIWSTT